MCKHDKQECEHEDTRTSKLMAWAWSVPILGRVLAGGVGLFALVHAFFHVFAHALGLPCP